MKQSRPPSPFSLRIVDLRVHSIAIVDPPLRSSYGLHAPYALRTIIELDAGDGLVGIGETHGGDVIAGQFAALTPRLAGADPFRLMGDLLPMIDPAAAAAVDRSQTFHVPGENPLDAGARLYSAIDIACLDLIGKALGRPVCDLLGGRARDAVPFSAYLFYKHAGGGGEGDDVREDEYGEALSRRVDRPAGTPDDGRLRLRGDQAEGAACSSPTTEIADHAGALPGVRSGRRRCASIPTAPGRSRPRSRSGVRSRTSSGAAAISRIRPRASTAWPRCGAACSREGIETPLASNVAVTSFADLKPASALDAVQVVLCDPHYWGGIRQIQHLSTLVPGVRPRPVDALEQPSRRLPDGHGARGRRRLAPDVRVRHALPVAG